MMNMSWDDKQQTALDKHKRIEELRKRLKAVNFAIGLLWRIEKSVVLRVMLGYTKEEAYTEAQNLNWVYREMSDEILRLTFELEDMKEGQ
jgi:hypothetical protein